ncbi:MAG: nitrous oxide-stimulated promoter family protein [Sulfurospirillaceae bacterium]|nr:nitrous oxide-stimulated promoter family protein [Sulfurospirillaceae bacterium]MDD3462311.1 nitrous oxide-stimulated promoter family protein [Sulfurospirillaceae bacterium]
MDIVKFKSEVETLSRFIQTYCNDVKDHEQALHIQNISYQDATFSYEVNLCNDCRVLLEYGIQRLQNCPHDPKPKCRTCANPCYEKPQWKQMAKVMRYSGMKLGLSKVKNFLLLRS